MFSTLLLTLAIISNALGLSTLAHIAERPLLKPNVAVAANSGTLTNAVSALPTPVSLFTLKTTNAPDIKADAYLVYEPGSAAVLTQKNGHTVRAMASTIKTQTALLVIENEPNLDKVVTVSQNAASQPGSIMGIRTGEQLTVRDLLTGMLLVSGNDAAVALSEVVGGTEENFVKTMNERAVQLQLTETHYADPDGYDQKNSTSSCYDIAKLLTVVSKNNVLSEIMQTKQTTVTGKLNGRDVPHLLQNSNKLVQDGYPNLVGGKTGTGSIGMDPAGTEGAGHVLISEIKATDSAGNSHFISACIAGTYANTHDASGIEMERLLDFVKANM